MTPSHQRAVAEQVGSPRASPERDELQGQRQAVGREADRERDGGRPEIAPGGVEAGSPVVEVSGAGPIVAGVTSASNRHRSRWSRIDRDASAAGSRPRRLLAGRVACSSIAASALASPSSIRSRILRAGSRRDARRTRPSWPAAASAAMITRCLRRISSKSNGIVKASTTSRPGLGQRAERPVERPAHRPARPGPRRSRGAGPAGVAVASARRADLVHPR